MFFQPVQGIDESSIAYLREIPASEILAKIENGSSVNYDHVVIRGNLNLSQLDLAHRHLERTPYEINYLGIGEDLNLVSSPIIGINDSVIEGCVYFNNTIFFGKIHFNDTKFNESASFAGSEFNASADFDDAHFNGFASFAGSRFDKAPNLYTRAVLSQFTRWIKPKINMRQRNIVIAGVGNSLNSNQVNQIVGIDSPTASVSRVHIVKGVNSNFVSIFSMPKSELFSWGSLYYAATFDGTEFNRTTTFENSEFNGDVVFRGTKFNDKTTFENSKFRGISGFTGSTFNGTVNFGSAEFLGIADFGRVTFNKIGKLVVLKSDMPRFLGYTDVNKSRDLWFWDSQMVADFWDTDFNGPANFAETKFNGTAFFRRSQFREDAIFTCSKFNGIAYFAGSEFNGSASFADSEFDGTTNFWKSDSDLPDPYYVNYYDVNRPPDNWFWDRHLTANFLGSRFNGTADFSGSKFKGRSNFESSKFNEKADFSNTNFKGDSNFANMTIGKEIKFYNAMFEGDASFYGDQFDGDAFFLNATFDETLNLITSKYRNLYIRWADVNALKYDDTTYLLLIRNFNNIGFFEDADNCYVEYKAEHRKQPWHTQGEAILKLIDWMSEILYGYGVRPMNPLFISCILILLFGSFWWSYGVGGIEVDDGRGTSKRNKLEKILDVLEPFIFSSTLFLSGPKFLLNPPDLPKNMDKHRSLTRRMFYLEQFLGAIFLVLFIIALGRTIIRTI